ncbi:MAG: DEAD/DEAH box helicase [Prevotella sp.]
MKNMDVKTYKSLRAKQVVNISSRHRVHLACSQAVNAYFNNQPYEPLLPPVINQSSYSFSDAFCNRVLLDLRDESAIFPILKHLAYSKTWAEQLIEKYSGDLESLLFTDTTLQAVQEVIIDNPSVEAEKRVKMKNLIGIYDEFIRKGNITEGARMAGGDTRLGQCYEAVTLLQQGDYAKAFKLFVSALRGTGRKLFHIDIFDFYYAVSMAYCGQETSKTKIGALLKSEDLAYSGMPAVDVILRIAKGDKGSISVSRAYSDSCRPVASALTLLALEHYNLDTARYRTEWMGRVMGFPSALLKMELSDVLPGLEGEKDELRRRTGMHPTLPPYKERPEWDIRLDELMGLCHKATGQAAGSAVRKTSQSRIIYKVNTHSNTITPVVQKSKDGINWTAGRNVSLENFSKGKTEGMKPEDKAVAACVTCYSYGWYGTTSYELEGGEAIAALVGHPLVFDAETNRHLEVVMGKPQLGVSLNGDTYNIQIDVDGSDYGGNYWVSHQRGHSIKVVKMDNNLRQIVRVLRQTRMPKESKEKLTSLLEALSGPMIVMSDLLKNSDSIATTTSHSETVVQLQPVGDTIRCSVMVRPFGKVPPVCKPGKGMQVITTVIDGKQVQTRRNLKKEKENCDAVKALMVDYEEDSYQDNAWMLRAGECLELIERLRDMGESCVMEWPEGERLKVSHAPLQPSSFHISINSVASWFELTGEVAVSKKIRLKIADLMDRLADAKGSFIRVDDKEYVRISNELRRHIESIGRLASRHRDTMRLSTFNAQQLEGLADSGMDVEADNGFTTLVNRIKESQEADIRIPKNIQADLRSYQKEGYVWMSRLAMWGAGALLADDMGLGKTVQAITLLLSRAQGGAQLVIVPTSLILNWKEEVERFAPSLNVLLLNRAGDDRKRVVEEAKAFDVVVSTYGLLITEEETLCSRTWHTVVLDEAHTIKNKETKMSRVAMELRADFRLLLTGTPLQNHVSELWNLMQFANPHLLGTYQEFADRFLLPIERDHNKERQRLLKRVITPFILRRTKNDVLSELPEKTEITLRVNLSEEEWAFYDNLRKRALANMEDKDATAMQALSEITRLRQAACNARLVEKKMRIESSKLNSFMELTDNLGSNHHRALVFSQFTSHLALIREALDERGMAYLYLDGATPAKERIRLVEEFQHGDMPLFLISLKAGGLGLNLTAADYVIHLDPWWNPAIEDQASDRAYRIGQRKRVTVYRIIAANTIEEKIVALHQTKKNMADALLEGGDVSASMSREEMIELLKEL